MKISIEASKFEYELFKETLLKYELLGCKIKESSSNLTNMTHAAKMEFDLQYIVDELVKYYIKDIDNNEFKNINVLENKELENIIIDDNISLKLYENSLKYFNQCLLLHSSNDENFLSVLFFQKFIDIFLKYLVELSNPAYLYQIVNNKINDKYLISIKQALVMLKNNNIIKGELLVSNILLFFKICKNIEYFDLKITRLLIDKLFVSITNGLNYAYELLSRKNIFDSLDQEYLLLFQDMENRYLDKLKEVQNEMKLCKDYIIDCNICKEKNTVLVHEDYCGFCNELVKLDKQISEGENSYYEELYKQIHYE